ncbi:MAG TPA: hypothetical protein VFJ58_07745 [Armatimonadota bacterium]|nr:hypothetical protein [Armatimonadota bacterium]
MKKLIAVVSTGIAAFAIGGAAFVPGALAHDSVRPTPRIILAANHRRDRDPNLRQALLSLHAAKNALQRADRDSAGHRQQALDLVQRAIDQTQQAMRGDR